VTPAIGHHDRVDVFATGGYDGALFVYDRRQLARASDGRPKPIRAIMPPPATPALRVVNSAKRLPQKTRSTVTSLISADERTLLSTTSPGGS